MRKFMTCLVTAATLTFSLALHAGQDDPRLEGLFIALKAAENRQAAQSIEFEIWQIWTVSGTPAVDRDMAEGIHAMNSGMGQTALAAFSRVVAALPDFAEGWNRRATLNYLLGRYQESIHDIEKTLELEPRHFGAWSGLGLVNLKLGHEHDALDAFEAALAIHPNLAGAKRMAHELRLRLSGRAI